MSFQTMDYNPGQLFGFANLQAIPPVVPSYPFTIGCWYYLWGIDSSQSENIWCVTNNGSTANNWQFVISSTGKPQITCTQASSQAFLVAATVTTLNTWNYVITRCISATNRRLDIHYFDGSTEHIQDTVSKSPTSINAIDIGSGDTGSTIAGLIAEWWWANIDIQADGAALSDTTLRQLAFGGPFSNPNVYANLQMYHSLRCPQAYDVGTPSESYEETYYANGMNTTDGWINNNSYTNNGPHPPLPYWYVKPSQRKITLPI